ncbi:hypothetical protein FNQ90_09695 [Streptomyces alkaliphilus]|uniref:N-acetyltransferase domain-containing protein n=1 Tax=Streptomyces alkaliphilus TaxID=1472722 RepID=A0A7W3TCX2_9ACTN|nr:hypothetical protein [Streptomyces alkaliphilus]
MGAALVSAAERAAAERGIHLLHAGVFAPDEEAVRFHSSAGFGPRGILLSKDSGAHRSIDPAEAGGGPAPA